MEGISLACEDLFEGGDLGLLETSEHRDLMDIGMTGVVVGDMGDNLRIFNLVLAGGFSGGFYLSF